MFTKNLNLQCYLQFCCALYPFQPSRWRAAEHLCQFIIDNPATFRGKSICELGAGLGLVAVLIDKLDYCSSSANTAGSGGETAGNTGKLVATDGDEPTMQLLIENKVDNECFFDSSFLYWGQCEDFLSEYPDKFQVVIAADVIYEDEQIEPLIDTVCTILQGEIMCRYWMGVITCMLFTILLSFRTILISLLTIEPIIIGSGEFILAFARRNVAIDKVFQAADRRGLEWRIVDEHAEGVSGVEPIYSLTWKKK